MTAGDRIGVLGGGQHSLLFCEQSVADGSAIVVYAPSGDDLTRGTAKFPFIEGEYGDTQKLVRFAKLLGRGSVVFVESERVPVLALKRLQNFGLTVCPLPSIVERTLYGDMQKAAAGSLGIRVSPWQSVSDLVVPSGSGLTASLEEFLPGVLEPNRRQHRRERLLVSDRNGLIAAWNEVGRQPSILERSLAVKKNISVAVARRSDGKELFFPPVVNIYAEGMLRETFYAGEDGELSEAVRTLASDAAAQLARDLEVVGLLTVEFIVDVEGRVFFDRMSPFPHASGQWTIDGCATNQYRALRQAILGLPFSPVSPLRAAHTKYLYREDISNIDLYEDYGWSICHYRKRGTGSEQMLGHMTRVHR